MSGYLLLAVAFAAVASADNLNFYYDNACAHPGAPDGSALGLYTVNCGQDCTTIDPANTEHSFKVNSLEPNQQVLLFLSSDCSGEPYTAVGNAYGSGAGIGNCVPSSTDTINSFLVQVYANPDGGNACPPTTTSTAPYNYPKPTG